MPSELIAQYPAPERDAARLLAHDLSGNRSEHRQVRDLPEYLRPGDLLVVNNTRVLPSRLFGRRASGGRVEFLLLEPSPNSDAVWSAMVNPARKLKPGERIELEGGQLFAHMIGRGLDANGRLEPHWTLELSPGTDSKAGPGAQQDTIQLLEAHGHIPLPPYIERHAEQGDEPLDRERYQTVYANQPGAVAAPTAGLHFTPELMGRVRDMGVEIAEVTLHVGQGTFLPVTAADITQHDMHAERFVLGAATQRAIGATRDRGGRVIAVGTTSVRVLESCAVGEGLVEARSGTTRLFLYPGREFRVVDAILTNFHLPHSSLLMLISAFAGTERVLELYKNAVELRYRFFSYGDAMFLHSRP